MLQVQWYYVLFPILPCALLLVSVNFGKTGRKSDVGTISDSMYFLQLHYAESIKSVVAWLRCHEGSLDRQERTSGR